MFNIFNKKKKNQVSVDKMPPIERFDTHSEYLNLLNGLIHDISVDSDNWDKGSFMTSVSGSMTFRKGHTQRFIGSKRDLVDIRVEFRFSGDQFKCDKIELKIEGSSRLVIEDCNSKISKNSLKTIYDFYCQERIDENDHLSSSFNKDKEIINRVISKQTKRDDKLNKLGI
jgi:hypothetical protein